MKTALLTETIDRWAGYLRESAARSGRPDDEQVRNWLFGVGLALEMLGDESLLEMSKRALEAAENGIARNRNVGAGDDGALGHSRMDRQRENLPTEVEEQS